MDLSQYMNDLILQFDHQIIAHNQVYSRNGILMQMEIKLQFKSCVVSQQVLSTARQQDWVASSVNARQNEFFVEWKTGWFNTDAVYGSFDINDHWKKYFATKSKKAGNKLKRSLSSLND